MCVRGERAILGVPSLRFLTLGKLFCETWPAVASLPVPGGCLVLFLSRFLFLYHAVASRCW